MLQKWFWSIFFERLIRYSIVFKVKFTEQRLASIDAATTDKTNSCASNGKIQYNISFEKTHTTNCSLAFFKDAISAKRLRTELE